MPDILSPADGKITAIHRYNNGCIQICTFLAPWDGHTQYMPYPGVCVQSWHKPGTFHFAGLVGKSDYNERCETLFTADIGTFAVVQIAGVIARTIVNNCRPGQLYTQGQQIGLIKFGSRVDLHLPGARVALCCKVGQRLKAGQTIVGNIYV